ncbi:hypothetical protein [Sphingomonas bacterium]|uniref:hypothetical protein n=1 Tax=Sphingomonas bacterium TaxID=1895847 RepID=UPI00261E8D63|nr:hypothetical protein [Sphingomonas bacterium]MDB5679685.1 spermidine synthase [Sphingomonas bacterium]
MIDSPETVAIAALYRPHASGAWRLERGQQVLARGYWSPLQLVEVIALQRDDDIWMSLTPLEIESEQIGVEAAYGHVAILGLGMGWAAAACALKPEVTRVTVIERDPDVIALHAELDLFGRLPGDAGAKVRIVEADALAWVADAPVDVMIADIWLPLVSDGRIDEIRQMQANIAATKVYFWGQELEIARHARAAGRDCDAAGIAATVADFALPLIGPDTPDYPARLRAAAEGWMRDRWRCAAAA